MTLKTLFIAAALTCGVISASAQTLVVDRGLPTANINNAAGNNRSNVSWGWYGNDYMSADDFTLGSAGGTDHWEITSIRTWVTIGSGYGDPTTDLYLGAANTSDPSAEFSQVNLYLGAKNDSLSIVKSANLIGGTNTDNAQVTLTAVKYSNGETYQGSSGAFVGLYEVDFTGLHISASSGQEFEFAVNGVANAYGAGYFAWFNHASNAALSGSPQDGSDNFFQAYGTDGTNYGDIDSNGNGWDKSSDLNIQVYAQAVPEPNEFGFLAIAGLGMLTSLKRKIKKS